MLLCFGGMPTRMEQKLKELKVNLVVKFEVQNESVSEIKEICNSVFKNFENLNF